MAFIEVSEPTERLLQAQRRAEEQLLFTPMAYSLTADSGSDGLGPENVVGVGLSERLARGEPTGELAVTVYVGRKTVPEEVSGPSLVPEEIDGVPTDVVESGEFLALAARGRYRPAPSGVSVGHYEGETGTLGFVAHDDGGSVYVVSNNHVLARCGQAQAGDAIVQPGPFDGGGPADQLAILDRWVDLDLTGGPNVVDAAAARVEGMDVTAEVCGIGAVVPEPMAPTRNLLARKSGRTTGVTRGVVTDANGSLKLRYGNHQVLLRDQALVEGRDQRAFSQTGDSGSLVVDDATRRPFGVLVGGSPKFTVVNSLPRVLEGLGLAFGA